MTRFFTPLTVLVAAMFVVAPVLIVGAPYESSMGLVQKIFYFHFPSWMAMFAATAVCGVASARVLFHATEGVGRHRGVAAAELVVVFGLIGLITGPLWGRKAWGVWWSWDARGTSALVLWLMFVSYLLLRRFGGPARNGCRRRSGSSGCSTCRSSTGRSTCGGRCIRRRRSSRALPVAMGLPLWFSTVAFLGLFMLLLTMRTRLERRQAELDSLHLALEDDHG